MKRCVTLFCCICRFYFGVSAQEDSGHFNCYLNDQKTYDTFDIKRAQSYPDNIEYQIIISTKSGKKVEEYFRHDDSSFFFFNYDSLGEIVNRGRLQYFNAAGRRDTLEIPDFITDPDGTKGAMRDTIIMMPGYYTKVGEWKERADSVYIWKGSYIKGVRQGIWKKGVKMKVDNYHVSRGWAEMNDCFYPRETHFFVDGIEKAINL